MVQRYNADLANNFGNLANRVLNMAVNYVGGVAPEPRADGPLVDAAAATFERMQEAMARLDFASAFGAVWDLIRATNSYIEDRQPWALHKAGDSDRGRRGARRLPRSVAHRRAARVAGDPERGGRAVAPARHARPPRARPAPRRRRAGASSCPGARLEKGAPLFPTAQRGRRESIHGGSTVWVDSHCHVHSADDADAQIERAHDAGVEWMVCVGTDLPTSQTGDRSRDASTPTCARRSACIRTTRRSSTPSGTRSKRSPATDECVGDRRSRVRPLLRALAARRAGGRVPVPDPSSANELGKPLGDPLPRRVGRHVPCARRRRRSRPHGVPLLHGRSRRSEARARPRLLPVVQRHRLVQERDELRAAAAHRAARPAARRDRRARTSRPSRTAASRTSPRTSSAVGAALAGRASTCRRRDRRVDARERGRVFGSSCVNAVRAPRAARPARRAREQGARPALPRRPEHGAPHRPLARRRARRRRRRGRPRCRGADRRARRRRRARAARRARPASAARARRGGRRTRRRGRASATRCTSTGRRCCTTHDALGDGVEPAVQRRDAGGRARARRSADDRPHARDGATRGRRAARRDGRARKRTAR